MSINKLLALVAAGAVLGAIVWTPEFNAPVIALFLFLIAGALALGGWIGRRQERAAQRNSWQSKIGRGVAGASPSLPNIGRKQ